MVAKSPDIATISSAYRGGSSAITRLLHEDGSLSGRERNVCYVNLGSGSFADVSWLAGLDFAEDGRAFAVLDLDQDGDLDLLLKSRNAPQLRILRNDTPTENHSIAFQLEGGTVNPSARFRTSRDAIGARIELETPYGKRVKEVERGVGFLSQSSPTVYFGLGTSSALLRATITWPSGHQQTLVGLPADHLITAREGDSEWRSTPFRPRNFDLSTCPPQQPLNPGMRPEGYALGDRVPTPAFALPNLADQIVTQTSLRGRPALLNFWATWCAPCQEEMRQWKQHYAAIRAAGAELVAISVDEPDQRATVERFVRERELPFPILLIDRETLSRYDIFYRGLFTRSTGLEIPTSFLLDADGNLVKLYRGLTAMATLEADLAALRHTPETLVEIELPYPGRRFAGQFARDYRTLGVSFLEHGLFADAVPYFEKALGQEPTDALGWDFLGKSQAEQGELERAREALEHALELRPDLSSASTSLGKVYLHLNRPAEAEEVLRRAARIAPADPAVLRQLGKTLLINEKLEAAQEILRTYLQLEPRDPDAHNALGVIYARTGALALAQESFTTAIELDPHYAEACKNLGATYLQARSPAQAVRLLERAVELNPTYADAYYLLGFAYRRTDRRREAQQAWEKVLELRPNDAPARNMLEQLGRPSASEPP